MNLWSHRFERLKLRSHAVKLILAGVSLCATLICLNSRSFIYYQLEFAREHHLSLYESIMLDIAEYRFEDDPKIQNAIGILRFERSNEELSQSIVMLNRVIDSRIQGDLLVSSLSTRANIRLILGQFDGALQDLEEARPLLIQQEAKGMYSMSRNTHSIDVRIAYIRRKLVEK